MEDAKEMRSSLMGAMMASQESFEEAKKKSADESSRQVKRFKFEDGDANLRILPLVPDFDPEGNPLPMARKGYEYPVKELVLKFKQEGKKDSFVTVCNAKDVFKDLEEDPIQAYIAAVNDMYASDQALIDKIGSSSFEGGMKYDSKRCMYAINLDKPADGIQLVSLSYSQYKEIEERKLSLWQKLLKNNPKAPCPISSVLNAYPIEVKRKTEGKKTSYSFNIDVASGVVELTEDQLNELVNTPRIPEKIYRYSRYHLEAVCEYLKAYDEAKGIDAFNSKRVQDAIEAVKLLLPANDTSHFKKDGKGSAAAAEENSTITLDKMWDMYDDYQEKNLGDRSEAGQALRSTILEFIKDNELDIKINHKDSNEEILYRIQDLLETGDTGEQEEEPEDEEAARAEAEEAEEAARAEAEAQAAAQAEAEAAQASQQNDDTAEPAARPSRRIARPVRHS